MRLRMNNMRCTLLGLSLTVATVSSSISIANASVISSSYGNAVHVDLTIDSLASAVVDISHSNGSAPGAYIDSSTLAAADLTAGVYSQTFIDRTSLQGDISASVMDGLSTSSLTSILPSSFSTLGSATINGLSLDLFSSLLGINGFLSITADLLSTTSKVDANAASGSSYSLANAGGSTITNVEVDLLGVKATVSALENQSLFAGLNIADFGLGIFVNEANSSCSDTLCTESRNAVRVEFNDFSLSNLYNSFFSIPFPGLGGSIDDPIINGEIVLASSFATTTARVSEPSGLVLIILGGVMMIIGRSKSINRRC
ncbi:predicted secreted protein with PEP-CTERM sorting signal [Alteromonas sp. 76-1]|uniref:hypothetical protein n=1 Tax=Alteromonas sp. 76-1 TaxID=2358187 RepID=UPI000FD1876E|nr:hypothetical protein [Alteromonas sp. 76-1]VEL98397.1 predicted secreted protein with PEP-CTERM sorting signal [Alteromonas sp. 76-1]